MADVIAQRPKGKIAYINKSAHLRRFLDAVGPDVVKVVDDFAGPAVMAVVQDLEVDHADTSPVTIIPAEAVDRIVKITISGTEAGAGDPDIDIGEEDTVNKFVDDWMAGAWALGSSLTVTGVLSATKALIATIAAAGSAGKVRVVVETLSPAGWQVTKVGKSVASLLDGSGGFLRLQTGATENDGLNLLRVPEAFELTSDQRLYFGAFGVKINDVTQSDFFLGLSVRDAAILGGVTDRIGFQSLDGSTDLKFAVEKNSTETLSAAIHTLVDATAVDLEFFWDGTALEVFVNGVSVATPAVTNLPNDEALLVALEFLTGEGAAQTLDVDKIICLQIGR
jgi:hypothetical protein